MGHTGKNGSQFKKWVTLGKIAHRVTLLNFSHTSKNNSLKKCVTVGKMDQTWKNGLLF